MLYCQSHDKLHLALRVAEALQSLHQKQIIHGDLNWTNVVVGRDERLYFGDLCLAMHMPPLGRRYYAAELYPTGIYAAPEIQSIPEVPEDDTGGRFDFSADIFSLGVLLLQLELGPSVQCNEDETEIAVRVWLRKQAGAAWGDLYADQLQGNDYLMLVRETVCHFGMRLPLSAVIYHLKRMAFHRTCVEDCDIHDFDKMLIGRRSGWRKCFSRAEFWQERAIGYTASKEYLQVKYCLEMAIELGGHSSPYAAMIKTHLASIEYALGNFGHALSLYEAALHLVRNSPRASHRDLLTGLDNSITLLMATGDYKRALLLQRESWELYQRLRSGDHNSQFTQCWDRVATLESLQGDHHSALSFHQEALSRVKNSPKKASELEVLTYTDKVVGTLCRTGNYGEARSFMEEALSTRQKELPATHPQMLSSLEDLGNLQCQLGEYGTAVTLLEEALKARREAAWCSKHDKALALDNLASVYLLIGKVEKASELKNEINALDLAIPPVSEGFATKAFRMLECGTRVYEAWKKAVSEINADGGMYFALIIIVILSVEASRFP